MILCSISFIKRDCGKVKKPTSSFITAHYINVMERGLVVTVI
jgi:hypothetical protein